jgi:hypothetical protein
MLREISEGMRRTEHQLTNIEARTKLTSQRVEKVVRVAKGGRYGPALRRRLAPYLRRGKVTATRVGTGSVRTAKRSATEAARQLPPPAQRALRSARSVAQDPRRRAVPAARTAVRRLPPSAQGPVRQVARRSKVLLVRLRGRLPAPATISATSQPPVVAPKAPKGPSPKLWREAFDALVARTVPAGERWMVVTPGSPRDVTQARTPHGIEIPAGGKPLPADLGHVAEVEGLRYQGVRWCAVPEGARAFVAQQVVLGDHLVGRYRTVADEPDAGMVFDLAEAAVPGQRPLGVEVEAATAALDHAPAVLDWTALDVAGALPGVATFRPPAGADLPYPDATIDVVVTTDDRDLDEARRVAAGPVIVVGAAASGRLEVRSVLGRPHAASTLPRTVVWSAPGAGAEGERWVDALGRRAAAAGATLHLAPLDGTGLDDPGDAEVVVLVEPGALPLPGALDAAAQLAVADPTVAVAGKVVGADGRLESAGGIVFSDRSVGLIGNGSPDVSGPWHDYVRPVCFGSGLVAVSADLWRRATKPEGVTDRAFLREWSGALWAHGAGVRYQPSVVAVRVVPDPGEPSVPLEHSIWQRVLDLRPARPGDLSDGAWRYLLGNDDVEACRR